MQDKYSFKESLGRLCAEISSGLGKKVELGFKENDLDYNSQEWTVISYLYNRSKQSQNELTEVTKYNKVAISRLINKFEQKGIVIREAGVDDKRLNLISLTKQGEYVYQQLSEIAAEVINLSFAGLSKAKIASSISTLQKINKNLRMM